MDATLWRSVPRSPRLVVAISAVETILVLMLLIEPVIQIGVVIATDLAKGDLFVGAILEVEIVGDTS